jgi:hypothetical protein
LKQQFGKNKHNSGNGAKSWLLSWFGGWKCENPEEKY